MEWPFKHIGPDGKTYLHNDNWAKYRKEIENGNDHNWHHRRLFLSIFDPKHSVREFFGDDQDLLSFFSFGRIKSAHENFYVAKGPFPAWRRTEKDPEAQQESWNLFIEDGHKRTGTEQLVLLSTSFDIFPVGNLVPLVIAHFREKYWRTDALFDYGLGENPPSDFEKKCRKRRLLFRDIDEQFQPEW